MDVVVAAANDAAAGDDDDATTMRGAEVLDVAGVWDILCCVQQREIATVACSGPLSTRLDRWAAIARQWWRQRLRQQLLRSAMTMWMLMLLMMDAVAG